MLKDQLWFDFCDALPTELLQSRDEGRDAEDLKQEAEKIAAMKKGAEKTAAGAAFLDKLMARPAALEACEPSDIAGIVSESEGEASVEASADFEKIYGAWLGRCAGCLLGQPVETWRRDRINGLLKATGNFPVKSYISSDIPEDIRKKYDVSDEGGVYGSNFKGWINNVNYMPEDDDTNYTIIALKLVEQYGLDFTPEDVAECWLQNLPILHVCTAERVAYMNLVNSLYPPESASFRNAYREYIGAQIRGDFFGYINPGNMSLAAEMAWRDASISHVKNGIYGEMWVSAMLSKAAVCDDIREIIVSGMKQIPTKSRLYIALAEILEKWDKGESAESVQAELLRRYDEAVDYHWCHTISNALFVAVALLWGEKDFTKTMHLSLTVGFDTDCNCATAGSVLGMVLGASALPDSWTAPLDDKIMSGVDGFGLVKISDMAKRTAAKCR